jgi:hypothetical protein
MVLLIIATSVGFSLMAGLRIRAKGFHFADPALLGMVLNIMKERQKRGMAWESPLSAAENLRRVYFCAAVIPPALFFVQILMGFWVR